ncbi:MAG: UDP-2,3-diacylglucosamine diphosphatase [Candidatus Hydrogenedentes bacterium]|nr:UDP-2,3-diacylglucosamine diphosphatase [Candidatus Hydrogenedentota bacterium]
MNTLIFSDVHLAVVEDGRGVREAFIAFLRSIDPAQVERIIILGDLFDFWFEYKHVIFSGYFDVLRALADLRDGGVEFHFICGNHDFWAGRFLEDDLGFHIHRDRYMLELGGRRALFVHGDGINPKDVSYRVYKRIARFPLVVWLFRQLHPDRAMALARLVSRTSRHALQAQDPSCSAEAKALRAFAVKELAQGAADVVMCGHCHYPVVEEYPTPDGTGLYINTGDWIYHRTYVEWDGENFAMKSFDYAGAAEPVTEAGSRQPV